MNLKSNTELIIEIKKDLEKKNIGQTELMKMLEDCGHPIAKTTIQRLFKERSEYDDSFSYKGTLQPIYELVHDDVPETNPIAELNDRIDILSSKIDELVEMATKGISFMKSQIDLKDTRMERKDSWIQEQRDEILELREENKKLEEDVHRLLEKCNNCDKKS